MLRSRLAIAAAVATAGTAAVAVAAGFAAAGPATAGVGLATAPATAAVGLAAAGPASADPTPRAPERLQAYPGARPGPFVLTQVLNPSSRCWTSLINKEKFRERTHGCAGFPTVYVRQIYFVDQNGNPVPPPDTTDADFQPERDLLAREAFLIETGQGMLH